MDGTETRVFVDRIWDQSIVPALTEYIRIPNKSPLFDPRWRENGHMARAVALVADWCKTQPIEGLRVEVLEHPGRTPLIWMEVPGQPENPQDCILLYGHLDKQPETVGWSDGLGPWTPVLRGDRLYGRGSADDGYAAFASLTAIAAVQRARAPHARLITIIEATEESGSPDLPYYIDFLADRIGTPSLVICLDSGCGNYDQLWCTTSLRGLIVGTLSIDVLTEGIHSGDGSGIVPSSFRIARLLLDRLEDAASGRVTVEGLWAPIPPERIAQAGVVVDVLKNEIWDKFPLTDGLRPVTSDLADLVLNRSWRPQLAITGADGLPGIADAGNVLRPRTALKLSLRLPPALDAAQAYRTVKTILESQPPYGAKVTFDGDFSTGWNAPALAPWLADSIARASTTHFGRESVFMGEGGSIPFMGMLGEKFPAAQFLITGVLGPESNAHGPNEFLHIPTGKKLTACVAQVIRDHAARPGAAP